MKPSSIADSYWYLHHQSRDGWTNELDLRPLESGDRVNFTLVWHPNSYLSHLVIPIEHRNKISFGYIPILLGGIFNLTGNI